MYYGSMYMYAPEMFSTVVCDAVICASSETSANMQRKFATFFELCYKLSCTGLGAGVDKCSVLVSASATHGYAVCCVSVRS